MALYTPPHTEKLLTHRIPEKMKRMLALAATSTTFLGLAAAAGAMGTTTAYAGGGLASCFNIASISVIQCSPIDVNHVVDIKVQNVLDQVKLTAVANVLSFDQVLSNDLNKNDIDLSIERVVSDVNVLNIGNITVCGVTIDSKAHTGC
jgi:hypothetical protein